MSPGANSPGKKAISRGSQATPSTQLGARTGCDSKRNRIRLRVRPVSIASRLPTFEAVLSAREKRKAKPIYPKHAKETAEITVTAVPRNPSKTAHGSPNDSHAFPKTIAKAKKTERKRQGKSNDCFFDRAPMRHRAINSMKASSRKRTRLSEGGTAIAAIKRFALPTASSGPILRLVPNNTAKEMTAAMRFCLRDRLGKKNAIQR